MTTASLPAPAIASPALDWSVGKDDAPDRTPHHQRHRSPASRGRDDQKRGWRRASSFAWAGEVVHGLESLPAALRAVGGVGAVIHYHRPDPRLGRLARRPPRPTHGERDGADHHPTLKVARNEKASAHLLNARPADHRLRRAALHQRRHAARPGGRSRPARSTPDTTRQSPKWGSSPTTNGDSPSGIRPMGWGRGWAD